jgi:predicted RNase H-like nuclease
MQARRAVLGIDAAWTVREPSGVALLCQEDLSWQCTLVAPSYDLFLARTAGAPADAASPTGSPPNVPALLQAARQARPDASVSVVAIDMPLSIGRVTGRRCADDAVSRAFGRNQCGTHSPSRERPGSLAEAVRDAFVAR